MGKPLWDFVRKRMNELGLSQSDLEVDYDIPYATMQRIKAGSTNFKEVTKQKLALALKCSIGDINAAISGQVSTEKPEELPDITDKTKEPPDVIPRIEIAGKIVNNPPARHATHINEQAAKKPGPQKAKKTDPTQKKARQKERWPEDPPEEQKTPPVEIPMTILPDSVYYKQLAAARQEAVAEYKQRLKDACLQALAEAPEVIATPETSYSRIGKRVLTELLKDDTEAE